MPVSVAVLVALIVGLGGGAGTAGHAGSKGGVGAALVAWLWPAPAQAAVTVEPVTTPAGLTAYLASDDTLPVITLQAMIPAGSVTDPPDQPGLAHLVSGLLDEGAGPLDSRAFQARLADQAIRLSFDVGRDDLVVSLQTTRETLDEAFDLLRLAITQPRFDPEPVARVKAQVLAIQRRAAADPDARAHRAFLAAVFGDHPYAHPVEGSDEAVRALTPDDCRRFVATRFARAGLAIGVAGAISAAELAPLLDRAFGDLPATPAIAPPAAPQPVFSGATRVETMDIPQSTAMFGQTGPRRDDPDWYAAYVVNYILGGGGFSSRLMDEVREQRGLAYSVYSYLMPLDLAGLWIGGTASANDRIGQSLDLIRAEWTRMATEGPTDQELADAKTYLTGAWPLRFTSTEAVAGILAAMRAEGLSPAYLAERNALIEAVTREQAAAVARRWLDPAHLTIQVVGRPVLP